jgi:hypothetical protein
MLRILRWLGALPIVGVLAIQLLPYGRRHTNPPVTQEPRWDQPRTRALAVRACFDCHSNETVWPWYSRVWFCALPGTSARLTEAERTELIAGLEATVGGERGRRRDRAEKDD